jgi:hypothetical protein
MFFRGCHAGVGQRSPRSYRVRTGCPDRYLAWERASRKNRMGDTIQGSLIGSVAMVNKTVITVGIDLWPRVLSAASGARANPAREGVRS